MKVWQMPKKTVLYPSVLAEYVVAKKKLTKDIIGNIQTLSNQKKTTSQNTARKKTIKKVKTTFYLVLRGNEKMTFWTNSILEPKRNFRFIIRLGGLSQGGTFYAKKCSRPEIEITKTEHKFLQHTFKYPARAQWNDLTITLVDPATPDAIRRDS